jgi:hypothetical protein
MSTMKKSIAAGIASLALVLMLGAVPASARNESEGAFLPANGLTRSDIVNWLQRQGYKATIEHDEIAKDDYIAASSQGVNWGIYVYACDTAGTCKSIQYSVGWSGTTDITHDKLNDWNRDKRYLRAYANEKGDVFAEYDIDVTPGGTWGLLDHTLSRWESQMAAFKTFIGR